MTEMATISAKIPKETKKKMEELGISPSEVFRKAIDREIEEREWALVIHKLDEARPILMKTSKEEWVRAIRESRDER
jgi:antitoxin component of RelBE/YafQ-DinJ toxin-antitoxin module